MLRNWVISAPAPRVAPEDAFQRQPTAFERPIFLNGLYRVLRTCRRVAAGSRGVGGDAVAVKPYKAEHNACNQIAEHLPECIYSTTQTLPSGLYWHGVSLLGMEWTLCPMLSINMSVSLSNLCISVANSNISLCI